jgi:dienelactone hydrolase
MKKLVLVFLLFSLYGNAQKKDNLRINSDVVKVEGLLWNLEELSKTPKVEWLDKKSKVQSLLYSGVEYEGHPTQVFAYYSNPDLIMGKPAGKNKFPGVVLIHGGGGKAFKEWVEKWAAEGYAAIAMDLSGMGPDGKKLSLAGPEQLNSNKFEKIDKSPLKDVWSYQVVAASILAHSFLLSLPEVNTAKTCVTGISWGGYLTCIVGSLDNRFRAAVPVYGCGFYDESDVFKVPLDALSQEGKKNWMRHFDPSVYLPYAKAKFCFVNGNKDKFYNVVPYSKSYKLIPENQRTVLLLPGMLHSHPHGWEPHEIRYFTESVLNEKTPLTKVGTVTSDENSIHTTFDGPVSLWSADFYFSNDLSSDNESRSWTKQKVTIDTEKKTLSTPVPKEGYKYGFFHVRDHRNLSASSEFILH